MVYDYTYKAYDYTSKMSQRCMTSSTWYILGQSKVIEHISVVLRWYKGIKLHLKGISKVYDFTSQVYNKTAKVSLRINQF